MARTDWEGKGQGATLESRGRHGAGVGISSLAGWLLFSELQATSVTSSQAAFLLVLRNSAIHTRQVCPGKV